MILIVCSILTYFFSLIVWKNWQMHVSDLLIILKTAQLRLHVNIIMWEKQSCGKHDFLPLCRVQDFSVPIFHLALSRFLNNNNKNLMLQP